MTKEIKQTNWISVGNLADSFEVEAFIFPKLADLDGKSFNLNFENGWKISHVFNDGNLDWALDDNSSSGSSTYRATSIRQGIYLIDFIKTELNLKWSVSLILDLNNQIFTAVLGQLPTKNDLHESLYSLATNNKNLTYVKAQFIHGTIDKPFDPNLIYHRKTKDLIGIRNKYRYSPTEIYEHIYLNENFYTWHCLSGVEKGLCDTDKCHYYKIDNELYLFVWQEKIIPTLGLVLIDFKNHRSDGKIFGYADNNFNELANFPVASYCNILNNTNYE